MLREFLTFFPKSQARKILTEKGTDYAGEFVKLSKAEGRGNYSTLSYTNASVAERELPCLRKIPHTHMEEHRRMYIHNLSPFFTTLIARKK